MSTNRIKSLEKLSFEEALKKLESLVESMETGTTALEELVTKFEEGQNLLKHCNHRLKTVELKIEQLKNDELKPFPSLDN